MIRIIETIEIKLTIKRGNPGISPLGEELLP
jgi:hypothetical protein